MSTLKTMAQQVIDRAGLEPQPPQPQVILDPPRNHSHIKTEAHIPPLLGVAPLGAVPLQKEHQTQFQLMESAFYHMPHPSDTERVRHYLPRNPYNTPPYYIQVNICDFYVKCCLIYIMVMRCRPHYLIRTRWSSTNGLERKRCFSSSTIWRALKLNIWRPRRWRNKVGGSTRSTWCGFNDTRSQKLSTRSMSR